MERIMIIDDDPTCLYLASSALKENYQIIPLKSGEKALKYLEKSSIQIDLILLDVDMPVMNGFELIQILKSNNKYSSIPVIFLTIEGAEQSELEGLDSGAIDYITKPFIPSILHKRIDLHFKLIHQQKALESHNRDLSIQVETKTKHVIELQAGIMLSISDLIEKKDGYTGIHTTRVGMYTELLVREMIKQGLLFDLDDTDIKQLAFSARLHDVGKIAIPDCILLKPGKLSSDEFEHMKLHTVLGAESILKSLMPEEYNDDKLDDNLFIQNITTSSQIYSENFFLNHAFDMARSHHEKWNGEGYPDGKKGDEIPIMARILSVADVYDALRSDRTYKNSYSHDEAVNIIKESSGSHFDPTIVNIFLSIEQQFANLNREYAQKK